MITGTIHIVITKHSGYEVLSTSIPISIGFDMACRRSPEEYEGVRYRSKFVTGAMRFSSDPNTYIPDRETFRLN